ncbi:ELWxxDGT repeat protein [Myxococcus sp. CA040A]|uniref:ELWxxDGT repeat protein n=1 Tax=Myxococcus sp. CA040A TaxID=2741738 RepID=UPI00157AFF7D|nr:ELWxxDGT repeat protein [Myxococcus sp. CA040A]NTX01397.1 hypothetical protein [Myxococcus sp. CA040A]
MKTHGYLLTLVGALASGALPGCAAPPPDEGETPPEELVSEAGTSWEPCGSTARRVKDIAPGAPGSEPRELVHGPGMLFFTANDGNTGRELWRSSGERQKTVLVKDILPGGAGSEPRFLTLWDGVLYFSADDGVHGRELWRSNGTAKGTWMVADVLPGAASSSPEDLAVFKNRLYFSARQADGLRTLWRSDGTGPGTLLFGDFALKPISSSPRLVPMGDELFFVAADSVDSLLWKTDGMPGGFTFVLYLVEDLFFRALVPVGDHRLFFSFEEDVIGGLMVTDGTPIPGVPTTLRSFEVYPTELTAVRKRLFFRAATEGEDTFAPPEDPRSGTELWVSDGTPGGTRQVVDLRPGLLGSGLSDLEAMGGRVYFSANDGQTGRELWTSDGTVAGTFLVKDLEPGPGGASPRELKAIEGTLFFSAETSGNGREVWLSDGTAKGTRRLHDIAPGGASSAPRSFVRSGWDVFFVADDGTTGPELWALRFRPHGQCKSSQ